MSSHPIDVLSLGTGVMFTVFALVYLIIPGSMSLALSIPLMLVGLGVFGLVAAIVTQRRRQAQQPQN